MKLDEMELLVRVAETGSMTLAARQLRLTPAAVSAAVHRIEEGLGVRLFERTTRSLHPTDEGELVVEACQEVVERWARAVEQVHGPTPELMGRVHISAPSDTTHQVLAPVIVSVAEAHPKLEVVVHSSDALQHLHRDAVDMAIRYGPLQDSSLSARKLAAYPSVLVASPAYLARRGRPDTPEDLADHRCITLQHSGSPVTVWPLREVNGGGATEVTLESPLCGDGHLARSWAVAGVGIACKSLFDVIDDLEAGRLEHVLPGHLTRPTPIHAVFPSRRHQPARVRVLDAAIVEAFAARSARCDAWLERAEGSREPGSG